MKDRKRNNIRTIIIAVSVVITVIAIGMVARVSRWNNGICTECGGTYILRDVEGQKRGVIYIYECDHCKKIIEM